ncbi:hypothetical protein EGW08_021499 [Elysia chlorotica]|uniref:Putative 2'-deoxynucleoside 5'-phosphate N-hydrolase 1 n=1 Tax=Elysia chlorotica TaxID=188477 RepID=A0A433SNH5_ELYCH|nr:hypothetical protein EGW08_021499 [Elysia chlorotica]
MSQINIYFAGSIKGGRQDVGIYSQIIDQLKTHGHVFTEFVGDKNYHGPTEADGKKDKEIHDTDVAMLKKSDCVVAEVTQPSLGVGYELGRAVALDIPILCLFRPNEGKVLSCMIRGAHDGSAVTVVDYTDVAQVPDILADFFKKLKK